MGGQNALLGSLNEISCQSIKNAFEGFVEYEFFACTGMRGNDLRITFAKKSDFLAQHSEIEKLSFEGIVDVRGVVGNFVDPVDELRFERRPQIQQVFGELRKFCGGIIARMLDDTFANFKREIQAWKINITLLALFDDTQRVQIVIKAAAMCAHQFAQLPSPGSTTRPLAAVREQS